MISNLQFHEKLVSILWNLVNTTIFLTKIITLNIQTCGVFVYFVHMVIVPCTNFQNVFMKAKYSPGTRGKRSQFSKEQCKILESVFKLNPNPKSAVKEKLSIELNAEKSKVFQWFRTMRYKARCTGKISMFKNPCVVRNWAVYIAKKAESNISSVLCCNIN